jgi:hypothetical protein
MAGETTIVTVERHNVRSGESLGGIARSAGLTWQDLATFNWGTAVPDEINVHLRDDVGCTKKAAYGLNYVFSNFDRPGIILVHRRWNQSGLRTDRVYEVKVEPLMLVVDYEFRHDGDTTNLSFTILGRQPDQLFVRLHECATLIDANGWEAAIRSHAAAFQDNPGYSKSACYREVQDGESVESLAAAYGVSDVSGIREHFENQPFRESRGDGFSVETGDFLFIPQVDATDSPIPLGELLSVSPADEQVKRRPTLHRGLEQRRDRLRSARLECVDAGNAQQHPHPSKSRFPRSLRLGSLRAAVRSPDRQFCADWRLTSPDAARPFVAARKADPERHLARVSGRQYTPPDDGHLCGIRRSRGAFDVL